MPTITISPVVRDLIEAAIAAAEPFWLGIIAAEGVEAFPRQQLFLEPGNRSAFYFNSNPLSFGPASKVIAIDTVILSKSKYGPVINSGPVGSNGSAIPPVLGAGDSLYLPVGSVSVYGPINNLERVKSHG